MADENKPAFYPRVGNIKAKNFKPAKPMPFIDDERAMDLPQYGDIDLSQPTKANLEMGRRMAERDAQLRRQAEADRSPLEKLAGGVQAGRFLGSALTQAINSAPTRLFKGDEAADKFMQERMYKPEQPLAYEYAGDVGDFLEKLETEYKIPPVLPEAVALQYLTAPATSQAMRTAGKGAQALERRLDPMVTQALERGGLQRDLLLGLGQGTQSNVIKPKGGNWLTGGVEKQLGRLKMADKMNPEWYADRERWLEEAIAKGDERAVRAIKEDVEVGRRNDAISNWIDSNLTNYVKKEMATPEDPVRKLAEQGVLHIQPYGDQYEVSRRLMNKRSGAGFPPLGMGKNEPARFWERQADISVEPYPAGSYKHGALDEFILTDNPWLQNVPDETMVNYAKGLNDLGFDHIIDVLRQDVREGRIRPEQLNKVSMEQAVRRTYEYDQEMARKMRETALKQQEGFPVHKEYPEGYKWIELNQPKDLPEGWKESAIVGTYYDEAGNLQRHPREKIVEDALKYEGNTMGHCVGGYCPDVLEGKSRIFSLRDAKGEPHVTIETQPNPYAPRWDDVKPYLDAAREEAIKLPNGYTSTDIADIAIQMAKDNAPQNIVQIKGKQNAKPKEDYLPYVQDFVRGGKWGNVGDLKNTGLIDINKSAIPWPEGTQAEQIDRLLGGMQDGTKTPLYKSNQEFFKKAQDELGSRYISEQEYKDWLAKQVNPDVPPAEGMKRGGVVISKNPDAMMLELGNKRMKEGGSEDDAKPYFGGAGTKKYAAAKKRAEQADVNQLKDPKTYAAIMGLLGEAPDQMGFSVLHPDYQGIKEVAEPAFYAGTALGVAPVAKAFKAPAMALGRAGEKYAEKVVPQIMERGGLGAEILGGLAQGTRSYAYLPHTEKNPNPLVGTRYKTQHVGNLAPKTDFDIQAEQGSSVMSNPWDLTSRGEQVLEVSDIPLTNQIITEGGHDFARDLANIQANIGGASGRQIAERMQDRVNDAHFANLFDKGTGRVFTMPSTMDVKGSHFSTMPTDIVMDIFQQAGLKPKDVEKITDDLRTFTFETERGKFANAAPVGSPEFLLQLRQGGKGFSAGDLRKGLMDRMSQKEYQKMLGFNIEDVYGAIGDQSLKGLPKGFVGNTMIETSPFADVIPATHQSYDTANLGKYAGSMPSMPLELMMPDLFRAIEINYLKDPRYRKLTPMQLRTMIVNTIEKRGNVISQPINQRVVDNVMRYQEGLKQGHFKPNDYEGIMKFMQATGGYKEGGEVKKPAAYIDGNEFVLAAKKYGIKDSMNNLNKIVDLVNKGLSVDDAARQVADTGMHKAAGGAITGDDLIIEERPL